MTNICKHAIIVQAAEEANCKLGLAEMYSSRYTLGTAIKTDDDLVIFTTWCFSGLRLFHGRKCDFLSAQSKFI